MNTDVARARPNASQPSPLGTSLARIKSPSAASLGVAASPSLLPLALSTAQAIRALLGLKLASLGVSSGQDRFLIVLARQPGINVCTLADELGVRPSTVSKMADRLIDKHLLQRLDDPADKRRSILNLTPEGDRLAGQVALLCDDVEAELTAAVEAKNIGTMLKGVALLNGTVHQRLRRLR